MKKMKTILSTGTGSLFLMGITALTAHSQVSKMPNIVFILADDLGWKDLGCYGNPYNETPELDTLAQNGLRFTQAYAACPVSSPTRASIMTGKYPARLQLTNFIAGNRKDPDSPVLPAEWKPWLDAREITLAELLKEKGYTTGMVGKWHLGGNDSIAPWNQGFEYTRMIGKNGLDYYNYSIYINSFKEEFTDHGEVYLTDKLTEYGVDFIRKNSEKPFFLYLAYTAPHVVIVPKAEKLRKYFMKYPGTKEKYNPNYGAMLESLDEGVGQVVKTLKKLGLEKNTLVVFTSDNGGLGMDELGPTPTSNLPLRKWKGHVYEGGIRIPAIISWPGTIKRGVVSDHCFSTIDYLPTICELAGVSSIPENTDGISQLGFLLAPEKIYPGDRPLYWHYPHFSNQMGRPAGALRAGDFKLVELYESGKLELYNLKDDLSETTDLSGKMPGKTREMSQMLSRWRKSVGARMPVSNPDFKPAGK